MKIRQIIVKINVSKAKLDKTRANQQIKKKTKLNLIKSFKLK